MGLGSSDSVGLALLAVEDLVGAHVQHGDIALATRQGHLTGSLAVDPHGQLRVCLAACGIGIGGGVDDHLRPKLADGPTDRRRIGDVQFRQVLGQHRLRR